MNPTLQDVAVELNERELAASFHRTSQGWVVWVWAPDDMALGVLVSEECPELVFAFADALYKWDGQQERVPS